MTVARRARHFPSAHQDRPPPPMHRRQFLRSTAALSLSSFCFNRALHAATDARPRKILFFSKSSGFEHSVITYKDGQPSFAEKVLTELGAKNGWEFTFSKDGSLFSPEYLEQFDALFFYTTGDLCEPGTDKQPPMSPAGKQALLDYVAERQRLRRHAQRERYFPHRQRGEEGAGSLPEPWRRRRILTCGCSAGNSSSTAHSRWRRCAAWTRSFPGMEKYADGIRDDGGVVFAEGLPRRPPRAARAGDRADEGRRIPAARRIPRLGRGSRAKAASSTLAWAIAKTCGRTRIFQDILTGGLLWALGDVKADVTPNFKQATPRRAPESAVPTGQTCSCAPVPAK